jgi:hypothetical protein
MMGICPPSDYQAIYNALISCDQNFSGSISKMELFMFFKRVQGISTGLGVDGMSMGGGMGMGGGMMGNPGVINMGMGNPGVINLGNPMMGGNLGGMGGWGIGW